jgi:hypothetical protein
MSDALSQVQGSIIWLKSQLATLQASVGGANAASAAATKAAWVTAVATGVYALVTGWLAVSTRTMAKHTEASVAESKRQFAQSNAAALQVAVVDVGPTTYHSDESIPQNGLQYLTFSLTNAGGGAAVFPVVRPNWTPWETGEVGYLSETLGQYRHRGAFPYSRIRGSVLLPGQTQYFTLVVVSNGGEFRIAWSDNSHTQYAVWTWQLNSISTHHVWCTRLLHRQEGGPEALVELPMAWEVGLLPEGGLPQTTTAPATSNSDGQA